jgi:hypothetical protein
LLKEFFQKHLRILVTQLIGEEQPLTRFDHDTGRIAGETCAVASPTCATPDRHTPISIT